jgi:hypothetical protein
MVMEIKSRLVCVGCGRSTATDHRWPRHDVLVCERRVDLHWMIETDRDGKWLWLIVPPQLEAEAIKAAAERAPVGGGQTG